MVANSNLSAVIKFLGFHYHKEESESENINREKIQKVQKDPKKLLKEFFDVLERNPTESCPEYHSVKSPLYRERRLELPTTPNDSGLKGEMEKS